MAKRKRTTGEAREREFRKRERARMKREKAAAKRERRRSMAEPNDPSPPVDTLEEQD